MNQPATNRKKLRPRRPIRGDELTQIALRELSDLSSWQQGTRLSWGALAERVRVTRQALMKRQELKDAYRNAKTALKTNQKTAKAILRRDVDQQIATLNAELAKAKATVDAYIEKWAQIERNCSASKIDPRLVFRSTENAPVKKS